LENCEKEVLQKPQTTKVMKAHDRTQECWQKLFQGRETRCEHKTVYTVALLYKLSVCKVRNGKCLI